jgi:hypothetical protein
MTDAIRRAAACKLAYAALLLACALLALLHAPAPQAAAQRAHVEWPARWDGRALRPLALGDVERRFAARFPGALARLTDGERQFVMRRVDEPTRMLHPAADCYRASGWRIDTARLERDADDRRWRCFDARRDGTPLRVCERIVDASGAAFTDTSAWFWAALGGRSKGPWFAVTVAEAAP